MFRYILLLTICMAWFPITQGRSIAPASRWVAPPAPFFPDAAENNRTRRSWYPVYVPYSEESIKKCHGMPCDQYKRMQEKLEAIMDIQAGLQATKGRERIGYDGIMRKMPAENGTLDGCIWLTEEQAELMLEDTVAKMEERRHGRKKRTLDKNIVLGLNRWDTRQPIKWKFDNKHTDSEKEIIRGAFRHWEENTCIRFQEIPFEQTEWGNHLMITKEATGCHSYVGKTFYIPQVLNLQASCLWQFGIPVHEIGHALGMWHEQQRHDRDDHIRVLYENLGSYVSQFTKISTVDYGVPYDPQSVMHYSAKDGSGNRQNTMEHLDPLFTQSFGQRTGLSFYNAKIINAAYCALTCNHSPLRQSCQRGGYQDPRDCSRCKCPDGWTGTYCERLADSKIESCGGNLLASPNSEQEILSPGYNSRRHYVDKTECNWHIQAPRGYKIELRFEGSFGVYCHYHQQCFHWVEVRKAGNMGEPGPRFCCYDTPRAVLGSDGDEMLVLLRANFTVPWDSSRRGFRALYKAVRTTTTNTPTPTNTPTTRATPRPSGPLFSCSFENYWCNTYQDLSDDFDWTMTNQPTPSSLTGPSSAARGRYYLFIETSNPRHLGDEATLLLPNLSYRGTACLRFRYHMYGFHIGSLRAFVSSGSERHNVFQEVGEKGNFWLSAQINVQLNYNNEIGFTGVRGNEYSGDIGLDDVTVDAGTC